MERATVRRDLIGLLLLTSVLILPGLGARDLWNPSEPVYGLAAKEMADAGEWLIPTVNGERFLEKPILYFWLARLAALPAGVDEWSLRLPSSLAALIAVAYVYLLGRRFGSRLFARTAALMFVTAFVVCWSARQIQMDLATTAATAATVYHGLDALERPRAVRPWVAAALAAGLGALVRGPAAWVYAAIPLLSAWWGGRPRVVPAVRPALASSAVLAAVLATWVVPLALRGETGILGEAIVRQSFARYIEAWDHVQPWWYYLKYLWIDMAPWALLLPLAVGGAVRRPERRLGWIWLIGTIVFFSFSASKRSPYLMPAAPAVAMLAAGVVEQMFAGTLDRVRRNAVFVLLGVAVFVLLGAAWFVWGERVTYPAYATTLAVSSVVFGAGAAVVSLFLALRGRERRAPRAFWAVLAATQLFLGAWILPQANAFKSARPLATEVRETAGSDPVTGYKLWIWRVDYAYYLGRRTGRLDDDAQLRELWSGAARHCFIVEHWNRDAFLDVVGSREPDVRRDVGSKQVELYCNR